MIAVLATLAAALVLVGVVAGRIECRLRQANAAADDFEVAFWSGGSLGELAGNQPAHPLGRVFIVGMREHVQGGAVPAMRSAMRVAGMREMTALDRGRSVLAIVAIAAPRPGLDVALVGFACFLPGGHWSSAPGGGGRRPGVGGGSGLPRPHRCRAGAAPRPAARAAWTLGVLAEDFRRLPQIGRYV